MELNEELQWVFDHRFKSKRVFTDDVKANKIILRYFPSESYATCKQYWTCKTVEDLKALFEKWLDNE